MIRTLEELKRFEDSCLQPNARPAKHEPVEDNYDITNYIFTQEIDCAPAITPFNENDCIKNKCKGMKTINGTNKCYDVNYDDIIRKFVNKNNFTELKSKSVLPTPDRGSCLFISIVESIARDNNFKLNQDFDLTRNIEVATNPKVTYRFYNYYFEKEALNLRNRVVDFIVHNWDNHFSFFLDNYTKELYSSVPESNTRSMRHPGTYADQPEIIAISTLLNINIHVLNISPNVKNITYSKVSPNPNLNIIPELVCNQYNNILIDVYIGYINGNHYFSLVDEKNLR